MSDPRAEVAGLYEQAAAELELAAQHARVVGYRRDRPRFCDSDLEADAVMLPTLAVQLAFRELNRDACRPAVQDAAS